MVCSPRPNYRLSEASIRYDARKADSDPWKPALETGAWGDEPWGHLVRRPIPLWKDFGVKYADYALERFKKRFGPMIDHPVYTTLFEGWDVGGYGGGSTNHAWSGGMLTVIAENICGLRPVKPGWKEFEVCPNPVIADCDITVPTVSGNIRSSFRTDGSSFVLEVIVPRGTRCTVKIPSEYKTVAMNGRPSAGIRTVSSGKYIFRCIR